MLLRRGRALREVPIDESSNEEDSIPGLEITDPTPNPEAILSVAKAVQF